MTIDATRESLVPLAESRKLPGSPNYKTIDNWCKIGIKSKVNGQRFYLENIQIGGARYTSIEAFKRFMQNLNGEL